VSEGKGRGRQGRKRASTDNLIKSGLLTGPMELSSSRDKARPITLSCQCYSQACQAESQLIIYPFGGRLPSSLAPREGKSWLGRQAWRNGGRSIGHGESLFPVMPSSLSHPFSYLLPTSPRQRDVTVGRRKR